MVTVVDERPSEFGLAIATEGRGRTDPPADATTMTTRDATVTVTALPDAGWRFARWTGDSEDTTATTTVVMNGDKSLTVVFEEIPTDDGVLVIGTQTAFPADDAGLRRGDIILRINRESIRSLDQLKLAYENYQAEPREILLEAQRYHQDSFYILKP